MNRIIDFLVAILANIFTEPVKEVTSLFKAPLEESKAINKAKKMINIEANEGEINLYKAPLKALGSIQCDHGDGKIVVDKTKAKAAMLKTGGFEDNSIGYTHITNSIFKSKGTEISALSDGNITIKRNASITQS